MTDAAHPSGSHRECRKERVGTIPKNDEHRRLSPCQVTLPRACHVTVAPRVCVGSMERRLACDSDGTETPDGVVIQIAEGD